MAVGTDICGDGGVADRQAKRGPRQQLDPGVVGQCMDQVVPPEARHPSLVTLRLWLAGEATVPTCTSPRR